MREIKHRARNANVPPCWVYGYFVIEKDECSIINDDGRFLVIAGTECVFTGLHDKNGREIYEGDVIKWDYNGEAARSFVGFYDGCFFMQDGDKGGDGCPLYEHFESFSGSEVIGTIHENPELIK